MPRILIAEDDRSMRQFISMALENAGYETKACADGMEAYEALQSDEGFDILLADIVMPGMDGIELSKKAKALYPGIKVMFITGFAAVAQGKTSEDEKLLSKPFHLNDLVSRIDDLLAA